MLQIQVVQFFFLTQLFVKVDVDGSLMLESLPLQFDCFKLSANIFLVLVEQTQSTLSIKIVG
jgi:hypothetical protein